MAECKKTTDIEPAVQKTLADSELERQNRLLREEIERLKKERDGYRKTLPPKERLYDRVDVSVKTMDMIIAILFILLGILLLFGIVSAAS